MDVLLKKYLSFLYYRDSQIYEHICKRKNRISSVPVTQASWEAGADIHSAVFSSASLHNMAHIQAVRLQ